MLAGRTERRDVPHVEGQWVEFRTLSGAELDEADERQTEKFLARYGKETLMALSQQASGLSISQEALDQQRNQKYDKDTLVRYGIATWSLAEQCNDENKCRLDAQTREWAVAVILEMNTRPLVNDADSKGSSSPENSHQSSTIPMASTWPE